MEEIIRTLHAMCDLAWALYKAFEGDGNHSAASRYYGEYQGLANAIEMLSNPEYARKMQARHLPDAAKKEAFV